MHTARSLTVSSSMHCSGGVPGPGGGVAAPERGVCSHLREVAAPGGVCSWGVSALGGVCSREVSSRGSSLLLGAGGCLLPGGESQHALRQTPKWTE